MITVDRLFIMADALCIKIIFKDLREKHPDLYGMADPETKTITLDWSLKNRPRALKCVLAEEIGHILFLPRSGHIAYHSKGYISQHHHDRSIISRTVAQDERLALDWATRVLMPDVEFWRAKKNGSETIRELAEWFDVEEWFVLIKIGYLRRKARDNGQKLKWKDIIRR